MTSKISPQDHWIQLCSSHSYQGPITQTMQDWLSSFGLPIEDRTETVALGSLAQIKTPSSLFRSNIERELSTLSSNPLSSLLYLLSLINLKNLTLLEEQIIAEYLLAWGRSTLSPAFLNALLAGIANPSSKDNAHLIILLFQQKVESFFEVGSATVFLVSPYCSEEFLLRSLHQLLYSHLQYLQTNKKCVTRSFIDNCEKALKAVYQDECDSLKHLDFSYFEDCISSHIGSPAGSSYLIGQLLEETKRLIHPPHLTNPLNPLLETILFWPSSDVKITLPPTAPCVEEVSEILFPNCTCFSSKNTAVEALIENEPQCFAVQVAILTAMLKKSPSSLSDILPLFEAINTYEPLKEAVKPLALDVSRQLQLFSHTFHRWQRGALTLYQEVVEKKNTSFQKESEDYILFLAEIIAHEGKFDALRERYNLLFPPIEASDLI